MIQTPLYAIPRKPSPVPRKESPAMSKPSSLSIALSQESEAKDLTPSPNTPVTPTLADSNESAIVEPAEDSQDITSLPPLPKSPSSPNTTKESSKGFLTGYRTGKLSYKPRSKDQSIRHVPHSYSSNTLPTISGGRLHPYGESPGSSVASLSHNNLLDTDNGAGEHDEIEAARFKSSSAPPNSTEQSQIKPDKNSFQQFISRSRSTRLEEGSRGNTSSRQKSVHAIQTRPVIRQATRPPDNAKVKTAPLEPDRSLKDMVKSSKSRNKSADRQGGIGEEDPRHPLKQSSSFKNNAGSQFLHNLVSTSSKAADGINKAGKGFLGKLRGADRAADNTIPDEAYICKVITLPLVQQTRQTRVVARMEDANDKTQFWLPALPYRCIDYLNLHGIEVEGLYRVPGSGLQVKHWQRRFDTEGDINLLNERDLYDINIIGSMFKAWLRELPDEIFPKETQTMIARECAGAEETPQLMKDELSKLPPFNYYLLFAITCHISMLHSHSDKNKMNFHNLCICFQPCMKIDAFCFQFLVMDWRNCWQGCLTERDFQEEEDRIIAGVVDPPCSAGRSGDDSSSLSDQPTTSPDENRYYAGRNSAERYQLPPLNTGLAQVQEGDAPPSASHQQLAFRPKSSPPPTLTPVQSVSPMRL